MPAVEQYEEKATGLFLGLQSYTEAQSEIFFGRDEEIERLTNLIKANTLTIVFGKSGTGKTSLLNAGVFPGLRKNYCLPFRIRLEFSEDSADLITQVKNILRTEIDKYGFQVESYPADETLWEYFHREPLWKSITPILIFDQFEEIFTLARKSKKFGGKELAIFWEELADLIENSIPEKLKERFLNEKEQVNYTYRNQNIKILFTFREEYLPEFEGVTTKIPLINYSRFRLLPMNGNQAYDVITKTWKDKIDASEAEKIVSFFTNEDEKHISYDLMEIEPSLLSQVCAYIDKERVHENRDKISSDFLGKYPKEKILRSIYDEALKESNDAVMSANPDLIKNATPVNEFVEEKLITDEGFRTKYSLNEIDESLRPGIEVLKSKYFLRDDGKSIELTHDVLTPFIKEDREERRKQIALALAKSKARKRATKIITAALLFSVIVAAAIWFFTTKKARADKEEAEKATVIIKENIARDSMKLDSVKKRINELDVDKNDPDKILALQKRNIEYDSVIKSLNLQLTDLTENKNRSDSLHNQMLRNAEMTLAKLRSDDSALSIAHNQLNNAYDSLKGSFSFLTKNFSSLKNDNAQLTSDLGNSKNDYATLKTTYDNLKSTYDNLKGDYDLLKRNFNELKSSKSASAQEEPKPSTPVDNNSLQLKLYSSKNEDIPTNLKIYLIPDVSANRKIIRDSKTYDSHYDFAGLNSAQGMKMAVCNNGVYSFPDVAPGDYFVKVCSNYGPWQMVTKKSTGNETASRLDIAEILK